MKTSKKTGKKPEPNAQKTASSTGKERKMEPLKSKELKNQKFDDFDDEEDEVGPDLVEGNIESFDDFYDDEDDDE